MIGAAGATLALSVALANAKVQPVVIEPDPVESVQVDYEEASLLAHLIYAEANTLGEKGMQYAGSVVLNRVKSTKFPDSVQGVIYQSGQYACVSNGSINEEPSDVAYEIAEELLLYGSVLPDKVVFQSEFIQGNIYTTLGNTYYCY